VQSVVATPVPDPTGLAVDAAGDIFLADANDNRIVEVSTDGVASVASTQRGGTPQGVAVAPGGNIIAAYTFNNDVVRVTPSGVTTSVLSTGLSMPQGLAADSQGDTYIADTGNDRVVEVSPTGTETILGAGLAAPSDVAVSPATTTKTSAGTPVKLTADLTPAGAGAPTGQVTFTLGSTSLGKATVGESSGGNDTASFTTSTLPVGTDKIVATYSGDRTFGPSAGRCVVVVAAAHGPGR
jgi:hypothetical protein